MNTAISKVLVFLLALAPIAAIGQVCPPGQYPVSGQGWNYCANIPGAQDNSQGQDASTSAPRTRWLNKWLSLTVDTTNGVVSTGLSDQSQSAAEAVSIKDCVDKGGADCRPKVTVMNGCVALAVSQSKMASDLGATKADAEEKALRTCSAGNGACKIYVSQCGLPEAISQ